MKSSIKLWVARDKDGIIWLHIEKPVKKNISWGNYLCHTQKREFKLYEYSNDKMFESVKWEDEDPREIECYLTGGTK